MSSEKINIAFPCTVDWHSLKGSDKIKYCDLCTHRIVDFSKATKAEIEAAVFNTPVAICGKFSKNQIAKNIGRYAAVLIVTSSLATYTSAQNTSQHDSTFQKSSDEQLFGTFVEKMAEPIGGFENFMETLASNIKLDSLKIETEFKIYMTFAVDIDGEIKDIKVLRGKDDHFDRIAVEALEKTNIKWEPATQRGVPFKVQYNIPVVFSPEAKKRK